MEDPEEKNSLVHSQKTQSVPLKVCHATCRLTSSELTMYDLIKSVLCILILQTIVSFGLAFAHAPKTHVPWMAACMICPQLILYIFMYTNLISGGWGAPQSRFWCDVKIMYARGFNTIRSITKMATLSLGFCLIASILNVNHQTTVALLPLLAIISEWQSEISENGNQYDIKAFDRFSTEDGTICMESLNFFQLQRKDPSKLPTSFFVSGVIRIYTISCLLTTWPGHALATTFGLPIVVITIAYVCAIPILLDLLYIRAFITFCQLEIYRIIMDISLPFVIVAFSLV